MARSSKSRTDRSDDRLSDLIFRDTKSQPYRRLGRESKTGHSVPAKEAGPRPRTGAVEVTRLPKQGK